MRFEDLVRQQEEFIPNDFAEDLSKTLVASDIDRTIVTVDDEISEQMKSSLHRLVDSDVIFSFASGRGVLSVKSALDKAGIDKCYAVCSDGALIAEFDPRFENGYKIISNTNFVFKNAIEKLYEKMPNAYFCVEHVGVGFYVSRVFEEDRMIGKQTVQTIDELKEISSPRLVVTSDEHSAEEFREIVTNAGLDDVECFFGKTPWMDVTCKNVTKQSGLQQLACLLGIDRENILAIGDGHNDVPMLEWSGYSVAMGDAFEETKQSAKAVTTDVYQDGCAAVFEALLNKAEKRSNKG